MCAPLDRSSTSVCFVRSARAHARFSWATLLSGFCAATVLVLVARDILLPEVRAVEIWFGYELRGWPALATAPLHYAIFSVGAWGFWHGRSWVWPWAAVYCFYIAGSHLVWNLSSERGDGLEAGVVQFLLFGTPGIALLFARPPAPDKNSGPSNFGHEEESR